MDKLLEDALECRQLEHAHVMVDDLAENLDINALNGRTCQAAGDRADLLGQRKQRLDCIGKLAALDVHGVGNQFARKSEAHRPCD